MRKLFSFMMATVDGYYEGPNQEFDFWIVDDEFGEFSVAQLDEVEWANTRLVDAPEELTALKQQPGRDIAILGSSDLTASLLRMGLVDELRIMVNPVVLGAGRSMFRTAGERIGLKLLKSRAFDSGNVLLYYQPAAPGTAARGS